MYCILPLPLPFLRQPWGVPSHQALEAYSGPPVWNALHMADSLLGPLPTEAVLVYCPKVTIIHTILIFCQALTIWHFPLLSSLSPSLLSSFLPPFLFSIHWNISSMRIQTLCCSLKDQLPQPILGTQIFVERINECGWNLAKILCLAKRLKI